MSKFGLIVRKFISRFKGTFLHDQNIGRIAKEVDFQNWAKKYLFLIVYHFDYQEQLNTQLITNTYPSIDSQIENLGVTLLVDPMSVQYLMGAEIDYKEDLQGAQFVIRNPNATTTCGCGSSFSV